MSRRASLERRALEQGNAAEAHTGVKFKPWALIARGGTLDPVLHHQV